MQNFNYLLLSFFFLSFASYGQDYNESLVRKYKVKSIKKSLYRHQNGKLGDNGVQEYFIFHQNGTLIEKYVKYTVPAQYIIYKYDSTGKPLSSITYKPDGTKADFDQWVYDKKSQLRKKITRIGEAYYTKYYIHNANNKVIEAYSLDEKGEKCRILSYKYYDSGERYEEKFESKKGDVERIQRFNKCGFLIYEYQYGSANDYSDLYPEPCSRPPFKSRVNKIDSSYYNWQGKKHLQVTILDYQRKTIKTFDHKNRNLSVKEYRYNKNKKLDKSDFSFFNTKGQLIESKVFYANLAQEMISSTFHSLHTYYPNGLKKSVKYLGKNGNLSDVINIEIEYH
ncbi:hypothetical protein BKI52_39900 [marine bacterium AO1-C]|nr:hypothetical protein BKI52_39900 [marine bacterium AO1-C]